MTHATFKGHPLFPKPWIKAEDLQGKDVTLTIDHLALEKVPEPPSFTEVTRPVLRFQEFADREGTELPHLLILNQTNTGSIVVATGESAAEKWAGKRITLYGTMVSTPSGMQLGLRIREKAPPPPKRTRKQAAPDAEPPQDPETDARTPEPGPASEAPSEPVDTIPPPEGETEGRLAKYGHIAQRITDPKLLARMIDSESGEHGDPALRTLLEERMAELMKQETG